MHNSAAPLSILLLDVPADAHADIHANLSQALQGQPRFLLAPQRDAPLEGAGEDDVRARFELLRPDIVFLGLPQEDPHGLRAARRIRSLAQLAQVVVLTELGREEDIFRGLKSGARGYVLRDALPAQVIDCLLAVARGNRYVSPHVAGKLVARLRHDALSDGELEILQMMAEGRSAGEIAQRALVSESGLDAQINRILFKISAVAWTGQATRLARRSVASLH